MLCDAPKGQFDAIVIYDITRVCRDTGDWFTFRKQMMYLGIRVLSTEDQLGDPLDPNAYVTEAVSVMFGHRDVLETRKKSRDGVKTRAKEGVFLGGYAPLDYKIVNGNYVIVESEVRHVRLIFQMYAEGASYADIIHCLGSVTTRHGQNINKSTLYSILDNERYIGVYTWNKKVMRVMHKWVGGRPNPDCIRIDDAIPPIIGKDIWFRVQARR